ncbi:hypothetical protein N9K59_02760 [Candidatus Thioglobus sp.]|nr:hypothetical protein [Candidatus Thioglobus sp.]
MLPVSESSYIQPVNEDNPYMHFKENRDFVFSRGFDFEIVARKHSNNYGYLDNDDFDKKTEAISVIGDSYVEAMQVDNSKTFHGLLDRDIHGENKKFYAIASSGAPLSQYLAYLEFASNEFNHKASIVNVVSNDFDESLTKYKSSPGFHFFSNVNKACSNLDLIRNDFNGHTGIVNIAKSSAFIRYIVLTSGVKWSSIKRILNGEKVNYRFNKIQNETVVNDSKCAVDEFFRNLPKLSNLTPDRLLFILDAPRPEIYSAKNNSKSYFNIMREYFSRKATKLGYEVLDLKELFSEDFKNNSKKFEFAIDAHWNEYGHSVVAKGIRKTDFYKNILK